MINLDIKATNIELTSAIRKYVEEKVRMLEKLVAKDDTSAEAKVEVGKISKRHRSGDVFRAEINLHIAGRDLRVVKKTTDLYAAIDESKDEIMRRLERYKTKKEKMQRSGGLKFKRMLRRITRNNE